LRLRRRHRLPVQDQVHTFRESDQARQPLRPARPREQAQVRLRQPDPVRALGGEAEVTRERQLEAAAQAVAADGGDEEERRVLHLAKRLVSHDRRHHARASRARGEGADIGPGGEELLRRACDDDGVDVLVAARFVDGPGERTQERVVVAVGGRPVEDQQTDASLLLQPDRHDELSNLIRSTEFT
jgi:hypothetical protein